MSIIWIYYLVTRQGQLQKYSIPGTWLIIRGTCDNSNKYYIDNLPIFGLANEVISTFFKFILDSFKPKNNIKFFSY